LSRGGRYARLRECRLARALVVLALSVGLGSPAARAYVPMADRTMKAIAEVNRASGRTQALQLELTMRIGDRPPVAEGELISHPSGLARLELRGYQGRVDRYVLSGSELIATKDGLPLERPRPMLQPFFLLQPDSEETLRAALATFGVISDAIGMAPCGERDCFVFGDPRLAAPLPSSPGSQVGEQDALVDPLSPEGAGDPGPEELSGPSLTLDGHDFGAASEEAHLSRLWVDTEDLQVQRIDRSSGVFMIVGPVVEFDRLRVPAWLEIHEPGEETIRFDVDRAVQVNAPAKAFSKKWLTGPLEPSTAPGAASSSPGSSAPTR
jgi:hypothetical protein